jgi:hypothetical protein
MIFMNLIRVYDFFTGSRHLKGIINQNLLFFYARVIYGDLIKKKTRLNHN